MSGLSHPARIAEREPDRIAYVMAADGDAISYGELEARSSRLARYWRAIGLRAGDTIAFVVENNAWVFPLVWSAQRSGLYYVMISTGLSAADMAYIVNDSGASAVVVSPITAPRIAPAQSEIVSARMLHLDAVLAAAAELPPEPIADESAGIDMLYSSGTTGRPKGVRRAIEPGLPITTPIALDSLVAQHYGLGSETRYLSPAPLYHAAPLRWSMAVQRLGGMVVVMDRFDAQQALTLIERHRIDASQWVPTHFVRMLQLPQATRERYDLSSMRVALHAAAPCPVSVKEQMIAWWGPVLHEYYAGTETNGFTAIDAQDWLAHKGSVGRALVGELRICGPDGEALPIGKTGDVYFANGPAFSYHNDPEKTASATNRHGWTTLGDVGRIDDAGYLYLTDRRNFMIISGGVNIYPQEIENALIAHPAIADVAVIGAPDPDMGEKVVAVVELRDPAAASAELATDIREFARARLGSIKTPRVVDFTDALPRQPTGKLYKRLLRDRYRVDA
ncbi:acyl-CoA synthetase [Sphingosinithalassobacter portus]|uniref:acyl-CoA synthetase n=1 Tax=Stakelama portus TaxID=2676234 RepID=UPI000D6DF9EE|nr:acyl-CoA synthetase [Sphingosinithalassobacter portus]